MKHLLGTLRLGRLLALTTKNRFGWTSLPGINTSLLQKSLNYKQKCFIILGPDLANVEWKDFCKEVLSKGTFGNFFPFSFLSRCTSSRVFEHHLIHHRFLWCHNIQHNDTQHNHTVNNDTLHNYSQCHYIEHNENHNDRLHCDASHNHKQA